MMPVFGYMDSHPFQNNQMPFSLYRHPSMETIPSHAMVDSARSRVPCDTWTSGGHCGYPMPFNSCCNGGNFPSYYSFRPPHYHIPTHQHMPCYGGYSPCPGPYHVQYVPPPPYNMEQPRYDFDKSTRSHHCCGCPNSSCTQSQNNDRRIKIEEQEPGVQKKGSLIPIQFENNQCPIVWIPSDSTESRKEEEPHSAKESTDKLNSLERAPKYWSGWPLNDMQHDNGKNQIPWPIIWVPAFGGQETAGKDVQNRNTASKPIEERCDSKKLISASNESEIIEEKSFAEDKAGDVKTMNQGNIPMEEMNHKKMEDVTKKKELRTIPVATVDDNSQREVSSTNVKTQSSSSPKKSKLPPICLRVDPPKKKNGNGHSKSHGLSTREGSMANDGTSIESKPVEADREKIVQPVEVKASGELGVNQGGKETMPVSLPENSQEKGSNKQGKNETGEECARKEDKENDKSLNEMTIEKGAEKGSETCPVDLVGDKSESEKARLSDEDAAVLIQAFYRGYEVRKWELLKKLRQIAEIRRQVLEVQNHVKALEAAPDDEKQRLFIGELIMRLLLKLDTIQGLHPSVREFRKSLAKELVGVQEKLDCITIKRPSESVQEISIDKPADQSSVERYDNTTEQEQSEDEVLKIGEIFSDGANDEKPLYGVDDTTTFQCMDPLTNKELESRTENVKQKLQAVDNMTEKVSEAEQAAEQAAELRELGSDGDDASRLSSQILFQQPLDDEKIPSSIGGKVEDEAVSGAKTEPNMEVADAEHEDSEILPAELHVQVNDSSSNSISHLQEAQLELASGGQDHLLIFSSDENEQTENLNAAEVEEMPLGEADNNPGHNIEMDKEALQGEENEHSLAIKSNASEDKSSNGEQAKEEEGDHAVDIGADEPAYLALEQQANCGYDGEHEERVVEVDYGKTVDGICREGDIEVVNGSEESMDKKLVEENEKMREMVEKLMEAGKEQLYTILKLSGRVKELEKKLAKKRPRRRCLGSSNSTRRMKAGKNMQYGLAV